MKQKIETDLELNDKQMNGTPKFKKSKNIFLFFVYFFKQPVILKYKR